MRRSLQILVCPLIALLPLLLFACGPKTPEEKVAQIRGQYDVRLNAFLEQEPAVEDVTEMAEMAEEEMAESEAVAGEMAASAAAEGEMAADEAAEDEMVEDDMAGGDDGPRTANILFDILVAFSGDEALPGLTVELTHADPFEKEKNVSKHYLETGPMIAGETKQVTIVLDVENFETGDVFSVSLNPAVQPGEMSEYREFAEYSS